MGLFGPKLCVCCGKKAGAMTRERLLDGNYVCFDCQLHNIPKYMEQYFAYSSCTTERYMNLKQPFDFSENVLKPIFEETASYGTLRIDEKHGLFSFSDGAFNPPLYLTMRDLKSMKLDFMPLDGSGSFLGASVRGFVVLDFSMEYGYIGGRPSIKENVRAYADKRFMEDYYTYYTPEDIGDFEQRFYNAWQWYKANG